MVPSKVPSVPNNGAPPFTKRTLYSFSLSLSTYLYLFRQSFKLYKSQQQKKNLLINVSPTHSTDHRLKLLNLSLSLALDPTPIAPLKPDRVVRRAGPIASRSLLRRRRPRRERHGTRGIDVYEIQILI